MLVDRVFGAWSPHLTMVGTHRPVRSVLATRDMPSTVGYGYFPDAAGGRWLPDLDQQDDLYVPPGGEIVASGLLALLQDGTVFARRCSRRGCPGSAACGPWPSAATAWSSPAPTASWCGAGTATLGAERLEPRDLSRKFFFNDLHENYHEVVGCFP
jgi:hypothetical protein